MPYKPIELSPSEELVDLSLPIDFSCKVDGEPVTHYEIIIYNSVDNTQLWTSTPTAIGTTIYEGETLTVSVSGTAIGIDKINLYWIMKYSSDGITYVESFPEFFKYVVTPTLTLDIPATVTSQRKETIGTYTQSQSYKYKYWYYEYYDSDNNIILKTSKNTSTTIKHTFEGFRNGLTYSMKAFVVLDYDTIYESVLYNFSVSFSVPILEVVPTVTFLNDSGSALIEWAGLTQITGILESGSGSYVSDFLFLGNTGYDLSLDGKISYSGLDMTDLSSKWYERTFSSITYDGAIIDFENTINGDILTIGRDSTIGAFYKDINGVKTYSTINIINLDNYYSFMAVGNTVYVREYVIGANNLSQFDNLTLAEMDLFTLSILDDSTTPTLIKLIVI